MGAAPQQSAMLLLRFDGRVFPAHVHITLTLPRIDWEEKETGLIMYFDTKFENGNVTVDCGINRFENNDHLIAVYNRAFDISRADLDLISFSTGRPFTVIFERFTNPEGQTSSFGLNEPDLAPLCTAIRPGDEYNRVLALTIGEPPLFYALRELIEAISLPRRPLINCARVLDILRAQTAPSKGRDKGWPELQANLRVSKAYLKFITDRSKGWRHGDYELIEPAKIKEVTHRTWIVMNRTLEFRKRGNKPLPLSDFPLLT
jgi:hypothetical protein